MPVGQKLTINGIPESGIPGGSMDLEFDVLNGVLFRNIRLRQCVVETSLALFFLYGQEKSRAGRNQVSFSAVARFLPLRREWNGMEWAS
jgi:hypothetical protein